MALLDEILTDLSAEGDDLDRLVSGLAPDQWRLATPAPGWTIAHQIGHLASADELAALAASDPAAFQARRAELADDFNASVDAGAAAFAADPPARLLARWRSARSGLRDALAAAPPGERVPWIVGPIAPATLATTRLMELFAHGQDIRDTLGAGIQVTDRIGPRGPAGRQGQGLRVHRERLGPAGRGVPDRAVRTGRPGLVVGARGRRAARHRPGAGLLPAGHAAPPP